MTITSCLLLVATSNSPGLRRHFLRPRQSSVYGYFEGGKSFREAGLVVGGADEPGLAGIRFAQDPLVVQHFRGSVVERVIASLPITIVARRILRKIQAAHGRM